jgi:hypothetical protein
VAPETADQFTVSVVWATEVKVGAAGAAGTGPTARVTFVVAPAVMEGELVEEVLPE